MTLDNRIKRLEGSLRGRGTMREPAPDTDSLIKKLGLDPVVVRATAQANEQSLAEVIASKLDMTPGDFLKAVRRGAQ